MDASFKGSDHIKHPDRKMPSNGDCLQSGGWHMALIGEKLASDATLDKVLCVCSGRRPIKTCAEGLANEGPSCDVVITETGVNFNQEAVVPLPRRYIFEGLR